MAPTTDHIYSNRIDLLVNSLHCSMVRAGLVRMKTSTCPVVLPLFSELVRRPAGKFGNGFVQVFELDQCRAVTALKSKQL